MRINKSPRPGWCFFCFFWPAFFIIIAILIALALARHRHAVAVAAANKPGGSADPAVAIAFANQPGDTTVGSAIGPVTVTVTSKKGKPVAGVTVSIALNGGSFGSGTTTVKTNASGQASFGNLIVTTPNTYTLSASEAKLSATSNSFVVAANQPALQKDVEQWPPLTATNKGDPAVATRSLTASEAQEVAILAAAIRAYRISVMPSGFGLNGNPPANKSVDVAQAQAEDMAKFGYVGTVSNDGENFLERLVKVGVNPKQGGAIAVGKTANVNDVMAFLEKDANAQKVLTLPSPANQHLAIGYKDGYWMIIIY